VKASDFSIGIYQMFAISSVPECQKSELFCATYYTNDSKLKALLVT